MKIIIIYIVLTATLTYSCLFKVRIDKTYYDNGKLKSKEKHFVAKIKKKEYYPNGNIKCIDKYENICFWKDYYRRIFLFQSVIRDATISNRSIKYFSNNKKLYYSINATGICNDFLWGDVTVNGLINYCQYDTLTNKLEVKIDYRHRKGIIKNYITNKEIEIQGQRKLDSISYLNGYKLWGKIF